MLDENLDCIVAKSVFLRFRWDNRVFLDRFALTAFLIIWNLKIDILYSKISSCLVM